jgi:transcriptional regulator with XRE-family HTH domain
VEERFKEEKLKKERLKKERRRRLLDLREKHKLSQHEVASAAGISMSSYAALEKGEGERHFSEKIFDKIAKVLKTTPNYIMFGFEQPDRLEEFEYGEFFEKSPKNLEMLIIRNNLIKAIFEIDDVSILRIAKLIFEVDDVAVLNKISVFVHDQKEYAALKRQAYQKEDRSSVEENTSQPAPNEEKRDEEKEEEKVEKEEEEEKNEKVLEMENTEEEKGGNSLSAENVKPHKKRKGKTED